MTDFLSFLFDHYLLVPLWVLFLVAFIRNEQSIMLGGAKNLDPNQVVDLINKQNAILVDVRDETTYKKGHISSARNAPMTRLEEAILKLSVDADKPIIFCCQSGRESGKAAQRFKTGGYKHLFVLEGGIDAWRTSNLPLVKT